MKPTFILCLFLFACPLLSEEANWYVFGGTSIYNEDSGTLIGEGLGLRVGVGSQFNPIIGIEICLDRADTLDHASLASRIEEVNDIKLHSYEIETRANLYLSLLGTVTLPMSDQVSFIGKAGYTRYSVESQIEIVHAEDDFLEYFFYSGSWDIMNKASGNDAIISLGLLVQARKKSAIEFSLTKVSGDWGTIYLNGTWRYVF